MKRTVWIAAVVALVLSAPIAMANGIGVFGSYWNPKDLDSEWGYGAKLKIALGRDAFLDIRGGRFEFEAQQGGTTATLEVIPLEAVWIFHLQYWGPLYPYIGGGGGYYLMDAEYKGPGAEDRPGVSDEFGWFAVAGGELEIGGPVALFAEAKYTWLETDSVRDADRSKDKLDGFSLQTGLILKW